MSCGFMPGLLLLLEPFAQSRVDVVLEPFGPASKLSAAMLGSSVHVPDHLHARVVQDLYYRVVRLGDARVDGGAAALEVRREVAHVLLGLLDAR